MNIRAHHSLQKGMTLLEVLIFVTMITLIFITIASATTQSIKKTIYNQQKIIATHYAEEAQEWMRGEKESDWAIFSARSDETYCLNAGITACNAAGSCWDSRAACGATDYSLGGKYKRSSVLTTNGSRIDVITTVEWVDGSNTYSVPINTTFSRWE
ncbi:type II secretion system protein [Candidatus Woesebacteria bacterium]|nr:type II secretion system protein [Candidatus Woesebacteria bacterium]